MLGGVTFALVAFFVVAGGWVLWTYAGPGPATEPTTVVLERGSGISGIAADLAKAGVIRSRTLFIAAAKLTGAGSRLKAGEYEFKRGASMAGVIGDIRKGKVVKHFVTVPEGWTSEMAWEAVNRSPVLTGTAEIPPEGSLLPDTYQVQRGDDRAVVLQRMRAARDRLLVQLWNARAPNLPFSEPEQAVTLASIVEKETGVASERPRVAAVFENRLRAGMRLESDPTIIYGISKGRPLGRGLTRSEIDAVTPYNTYKIAGLPPTPIANPGKAALAAVLNPPQTNELFFVADGSGGHAFASTFAEHDANVKRWLQTRRERAAATGGK
jgi:UPF0755 protein